MTSERELLRIESLRNYLMDVLAVIGYEQINVNFLSNEANNYSLDKIPTESTVEKWISGVEIHRDVFSFRSRMNYSVDVIENIANTGFYEQFEKEIANRNKSRNLPTINGIESIECLNCGSMVNANTNTAEFDIQIQITYREQIRDISVSL